MAQWMAEAAKNFYVSRFVLYDGIFLDQEGMMVKEKKGRGPDEDFKQNGQRQPYTASLRRQRATQAANGVFGLDVDKAQSSHSLPSASEPNRLQDMKDFS